MQTEKVFRKEVLDRLASPEQLHTLMQVTNARGWLALAGFGVILVSAVVWSFTGRIPTKVGASGILIHAGGLADVVAVSEGQISTLDVEPGDIVRRGEVIARIAQPELRQQVATLESRLAATSVQRIEADPELQDAQRQLEILRGQLERREHVVSSSDGRVVELRAAPGDVVVPGVPIVSLERIGENAPIEALLYVDSREGKTLRAGHAGRARAFGRRAGSATACSSGRVRDGRGLPLHAPGHDARAAQRAARRLVHPRQRAERPSPCAPSSCRARRTPSGYRWSSRRGRTSCSRAARAAPRR